MNVEIFTQLLQNVPQIIVDTFGRLLFVAIKKIWLMLFNPFIIKIVVLIIFIEILRHIFQSNTKRRGFYR